MEFKKGYYYFTKDKNRMIYVLSVCTCEGCKERGFYEPYAVRYNIDCLPIEDYITIYEKDDIIAQIDKITNDRNDEDVQRFFEDARTVALTEVSEMIEK